MFAEDTLDGGIHLGGVGDIEHQAFAFRPATARLSAMGRGPASLVAVPMTTGEHRDGPVHAGCLADCRASAGHKGDFFSSIPVS